VIQPDLVLKEQTQRNVPCALQNGAQRRKGPAARTEHSAAPTSSAALRVGTSFASLRWGATRLGDGDGPAGARNLRHAEEQRGRSAYKRDAQKGANPRPQPRKRPQTRAKAAPTSSAALRVGASFASLLSDRRLPRPKAVEAAGATTLKQPNCGCRTAAGFIKIFPLYRNNTNRF